MRKKQIQLCLKSTILMSVLSCSQPRSVDVYDTCVATSSSTGLYLNEGWKSSPHHFLPWETGLEVRITQIPGVGSHIDWSVSGGQNQLYAWDFGLGNGVRTIEGKPILAAVKGTVTAIKRDGQIFDTSLFSVSSAPSYVKTGANYVNIKWDDDISSEIGYQALESQYLHFFRVADNLQVGDTVEVGDFLGTAGCTGWCTGTHLHYLVQKPKAGTVWGESVPVNFAENIPSRYTTVTSQLVKSFAPNPEEEVKEGDNTPIEIKSLAEIYRGLCDSQSNPQQRVCISQFDDYTELKSPLLVCDRNPTFSHLCSNGCKVNPNGNDTCLVAVNEEAAEEEAILAGSTSNSADAEIQSKIATINSQNPNSGSRNCR